MRITRNMMNMSSRRAKQPINQTSLLNSIAQSQPNSRLASLMKSSAAKRGFSPLKSTSYSGLEKSADSLTIDETKLESADLDALQKVFGPQGGFGKRVSYIGERIADYAQSNQQNVNSLYGSRGNAYSTLFGSRFNRRG